MSLWALSYAVPKRRGSVVLGSDLGTAFKGNPRYLFEHLLEHPELELQPTWVTKDTATYEDLRRRNLPACFQWSLECYWQLLRAEFLVVDFTPLDLFYLGETTFGRFRFIQTHHGMPIKRVGQLALEEGRGRRPQGILALAQPFTIWAKRHFVYNILLANYEVVIAQSADSQRDLAELFVNDNVQILGAPRNDAFFVARENGEVRQRLELDRYEQVILYCPTWRDEKERVEPFTDAFLKKLDEWLLDTNTVFLVKKHPLDRELFLGAKLTNVRDISHLVPDVQDCAIHADVLVTDYSSICFDFSLTERPILYYCHDHATYLQECRGMIYDYFQTLPGPFARHEDELLRLLATVSEWFPSAAHQGRYQAFINRFNQFRDGSASARLALLLKDMQGLSRKRPRYLHRLLEYRKKVRARNRTDQRQSERTARVAGPSP